MIEMKETQNAETQSVMTSFYPFPNPYTYTTSPDATASCCKFPCSSPAPSGHTLSQ
jgi:hypothetical protein